MLPMIWNVFEFTFAFSLLLSVYYFPPTMLREGSAFSCICLSFCSQVPDPSIRLKCLLLPPATKLGQGNIFTDVCDSVRRGVCLSACWDTPLPGTRQAPPPKQSILGDTVNERAVCILMECNIVFFLYHWYIITDIYIINGNKSACIITY